MDSRNTPMGDGGLDWSDSIFNDNAFADSMTSDSPFGSSAFNDFTNMGDYADSPGGLQMRAPSKSGPDAGASSTAQPQQAQPQGMVMGSTTSVDTSSQDSSSDSSSRRKRKTTSESPMSDADGNKEDSLLEMKAPPRMQVFGNNAKAPGVGMDTTMADSYGFDFTTSGESSPINPNYVTSALSLDNQIQNMKMQNVAQQFVKHESPIQTINPATFSLGGSRDQSPAMMQAAMFNNSPNAVFSASSEDSNETFNGNQTFNIAQNPAWNNDFTNQYTSPGALQITPSPHDNATPSVNGKGSGSVRGRSKLHIAPISTKSRVETQINVIMTLEKPPPNTDYLHLPLHTIAKSKLLAKEEVDRTKALELHTMLVCTSAMRNPELKEKALQRAGAQNNMDIQHRAELARENPDEDRNDLKNIPEDDKPSNGGEVRICNNCIQRERKRAGRKKLKKEEEQQHWERYETERVVVFNSNEFLSFKHYEPGQQHQKDTGLLADDYVPPEGAMHVTAAMRIACYCRHQSEKEGFQVIFTMKDQEGNIIAQEMSDSILITDDHKTHPPSFSAHVPEQMMYGQMYPAHGLPTSYSLMDIPAQMQTGFPSSRSTGNLQALGGFGGQQFNPQSHMHQLQNSGFNSTTTSATMTPTSLSRPGSPTSSGNAGPNKKRKSSSFHRKVPSGLTMTPRVDTNQGQASNGQAGGLPMTSPFSPTSAGFNGQTDQSYMTIPTNGGPAQFIASGPSTPAMESAPFAFNSGPPSARGMPQQDNYYHSAPGSRVGSRAPSPVGANRVNLAAYARQQMAPSQPPPRQQAYAQQPPTQPQQQPQVMPGSAGNDADPTANMPMIHKISPHEGPTSGGTEVSIYGRNFTPTCQIYFGDQLATGLTFYGDQAMLCVTPPGRIGAVHVHVVTAGNVPQYSPAQANKPIFSYKNSNERMMEMALRYLSQQQTGNPNNWYQVAQSNANDFMTSNVGRAGLGQGFDGGNMLSIGPAMLEDTIVKIFELADGNEGAHVADLDLLSETGESMLSLASSSGLLRVVAQLLARGANIDIRDASGWTPLMHAALQSNVDIFQLLTVKGADPAIRSLSGFSACGVAPSQLREELYNILLTAKRIYDPRMDFAGQRANIASVSSTPSWDISSASFYESEVDTSSQCTPSAPTSRRPSVQGMPASSQRAHDALERAALATFQRQGAAGKSSITHPTHAWSNTIAAQFHSFQESLQARMPQFSLHLPPSKAQRSMPQHCVDTRPPAYTELFPNCSGSSDSKATANVMNPPVNDFQTDQVVTDSGCTAFRLMDAMPSWLCVGSPALTSGG